MALELLVSPPGTGKTSACIDWFKNEILKTKSGIDSRSFFVLPNREHAERIQALVLRKGVEGLFNAHILTINDLAARMADVFAARRPTDAVRRNILREILEEGSVAFTAIARVKDTDGFRRLLLDTLKEFKSSLLSIRELERRVAPLLRDPAFGGKFRDFASLVKAYNLRLETLGLREPEEDIWALVKGRPGTIQADLVIFDGFYHFSRAQRLLVKAVSRRSRRTVVTLTLPESGEQRALFDYPERTRVFLDSAGFREKKSLFKKNFRTRDAALVHLGENIFLESPRVYDKPQGSVEFFEAPTPRAEMEMVARRILGVYRERRLHFSDICVILREITPYEKIIRSVFAGLGVPVHVHERKKLLESGFAGTLFRFLNLPLEDWKREDVFFVLKSSYFPFSGDFRGLGGLESAVFSQNLLEGRPRWEALAQDPKTDPSVREALRRVLDAESGLLGSDGIKGFCGRLLSFVRGLRLSEADEMDTETLKAVEGVLQAARVFYEGHEGRPFSPAAFFRELRGNLETALFSLRPPQKNRVQVYDVVMALPKEYQVVFISGLAEKIFPRAVTEDPLFKDHERRLVNRDDEVLEERARRAGGERYFFYMALTRAKERLYLTSPLTDGEGRPMLVSFFAEEARRCFRRARRTRMRMRAFLPEPEEWSTEEDVRRGLAEKLFQRPVGPSSADFEAGGRLLPVLADRLDDAPFREITRIGFSPKTARIDHPELRRFFRSMQAFSATRLEAFATCAFKFFAGKALGLNEPRGGREHLQMGSLLHETLETFYKGLSPGEREDPLFWQDETKVRAALERGLRQAFSADPFGDQPLYRRRLYFERMRRVLDAFYERERALSGKRDLVPARFELDFGRKGSALGPLRIEDESGQIRIEGQIDRVDVTRDGRRALVIDYKKSARSRTLAARLEKGLELQLPIYLLATRRLLGLEPLGAELRLLEQSREEGLYHESSLEALRLGARKKVYTTEEFETLLSGSERLIRAYVSRLRDADIRVRSKSCEHCKFDDVCRFEKWRLIYSETDDDDGD